MGITLVLAGSISLLIRMNVLAGLFHRQDVPLERPVQHGAVASASELHAQGKLYFVPMGRQAIPVQSLADYYRQKFDLDISILPEAPLKGSSCVPERQQCIADEMLEDLKQAYPKIASDGDSVIIALTDEDLFGYSFPNFTYSLREGYRFGVVSTRRMDPAFWNDPPDEAKRLASTRQMLTKYIALLCLHVPISFDPTSTLYQPLTPDGGKDDIYESDIHSEQSANGLRGQGWPCLSFRYSYKTGTIKPLQPPIMDCRLLEKPNSTTEETFQTMLSIGEFVDRSVDLQLQSVPEIELLRGYVSYANSLKPKSMGIGTDHNFNAHLESDGLAKLNFIRVFGEDNDFFTLDRATPGHGFTAGIAFQNRSDNGELYEPRLTPVPGHFKLLYPDGSWATYLPCGNQGDCFWDGYADAHGNKLNFDRDGGRNLHSVQAADQQKVEFKLDDRRRVVAATASSGAQVLYTYDENGCLARVLRPDGQVTLYTYDSGHRMTQIAVKRNQGKPRTIVSNEYDSTGRLVAEEVTGIGLYRIHYDTMRGDRSQAVRVTDPDGTVWHLVLLDEAYVARTWPLRFPVIAQTH